MKRIFLLLVALLLFLSVIVIATEAVTGDLLHIGSYSAELLENKDISRTSWDELCDYTKSDNLCNEVIGEAGATRFNPERLQPMIHYFYVDDPSTKNYGFGYILLEGHHLSRRDRIEISRISLALIKRLKCRKVTNTVPRIPQLEWTNGSGKK